MSKGIKFSLVMLVSFAVAFLSSSCSNEEPIDIDLTFTKTEAETYQTISTESNAQENVDTSSELSETAVTEETEQEEQTVPPDMRIPWDGLELSIADAVKVDDYVDDAFYDFSYIRYGTNLYMDSDTFKIYDFENKVFNIDPYCIDFQSIEYVKVEKGQEISNGLKVSDVEMILARGSYNGYSEVVLSEIKLEGSVTREGFLWFYDEDDPMVGGAVLFAADPTKNSEIPINIISNPSTLWYSNDHFAFIMDSNAFFVGGIDKFDTDISNILRESHCVKVRATLTDITLQCYSRASGYNHSSATIIDVEILQ